MTERTTFDLCVIGAGPAGMAAASEAATLGLDVLVLDEAPRPGGQIWRDVAQATTERLAILGADYAQGADLVRSFADSAVDYRPASTVWHIEATDPGFNLLISSGGRSCAVRAAAVVSATGALERPMPLPGWTLPGVTTAGALQILLKSAGVVAQDAVLIGNGPLLYLIASQMILAGCSPRAMVETVPRGNWLAAARHLPRALRALPYLIKGASMMRAIARAGVPVHRGATGIRLEGKSQLEAVHFETAGRQQRIETTCAALHHGVVPNQQITRLMRCDHLWDAQQVCFRPVLDAWGETTCPDLYVAGDGGGIRGAKSAVLAGRLVARRAAAKAGRDTPNDKPLRAALRRDAHIRPFLQALYAPFAEALAPADDTLVCRCEEVSAGEIRKTVRANAVGPNQVKSFLRTGMGPCQGRVCGLVVSQLIAAERGEDPGATGYFRIRPPLKPLALSELAEFDADEPHARTGR